MDNSLATPKLQRRRVDAVDCAPGRTEFRRTWRGLLHGQYFGGCLHPPPTINFTVGVQKVVSPILYSSLPWRSPQKVRGLSEVRLLRMVEDWAPARHRPCDGGRHDKQETRGPGACEGKGLLTILQSVFPVFRISMKMCDGNNQDVSFVGIS